jgi:excisionase family DNA binding protein
VSSSPNPLKPPKPLMPRPRGRLTMGEGASRAGCSLRHLYTLAYSGEIPTYKAAGHRWIDEEDIDAYIARCKAAGPDFDRATGKRGPGRPKGKTAKQPSSTAAE